MTIWTLIAALSYVIIANWLWRTIVIAEASANDVNKCRNEAELEAMLENRAFLQASERAGTVPHLTVKASFVLTWPLWLLVGCLAAHVLDALDGQ